MKVALDTNVLAYAEDTNGTEKKEAANRLGSDAAIDRNIGAYGSPTFPPCRADRDAFCWRKSPPRLSLLRMVLSAKLPEICITIKPQT